MIIALFMFAIIVGIAHHDRQKEDVFEQSLRDMEYAHRMDIYGGEE